MLRASVARGMAGWWRTHWMEAGRAAYSSGEIMSGKLSREACERRCLEVERRPA